MALSVRLDAHDSLLHSRMSELFLDGNEQLTSPPAEVISQGSDAVIEFLCKGELVHVAIALFWQFYACFVALSNQILPMVL